MATVVISQGILKGGEAVTDSGFKYYEFYNIPYAQPPIGHLRFKSPQPPESWEGEKDATTCNADNISCQNIFMTEQVAGSEDCLYLNVYTPKLSSVGSKQLPVMFYIHGGGFVVGNGIVKIEANPELLVEKGVVVVAINYRLGVFGFLNLDIPEASGNMGLKDQVRALKWVQKNISQFGGDKHNVTIFGNSAGSASVEYLILSPLAKGLFHKAILQSGSTLNDWAINFEHKQLAINLAINLGYSGDVEERRDICDFLLKVSAEQMLGAVSQVIKKFSDKSIFFGFVPTIEKDFDDAFLTSNPYKLLKDGNFNKVTILRGFCNMEGALVCIMNPNAIKELVKGRRFLNFWSYRLDNDDDNKYNAEFRNLYLENDKSGGDPEKTALDFFGDLHFSAGIWVACNMFAKHGLTEFVYKFIYDGKNNFGKKMFGLSTKGAGHGDDYGYILTTNLIKLELDETDILLRARMTTMWTNFAKTGKPTLDEQTDIPIEWPKFDNTTQAYLVIDKEFKIDRYYEPEKMAVFEKIYEKYKK